MKYDEHRPPQNDAGTTVSSRFLQTIWTGGDLHERCWCPGNLSQGSKPWIPRKNDTSTNRPKENPMRDTCGPVSDKLPNLWCIGKIIAAKAHICGITAWGYNEKEGKTVMMGGNTSKMLGWRGCYKGFVTQQLSWSERTTETSQIRHWYPFCSS